DDAMTSLLTGPVTIASATPRDARSHAASIHASCAAPSFAVGLPGLAGGSDASGLHVAIAPRGSDHASSGAFTATKRARSIPRSLAARSIARRAPTRSTRASASLAATTLTSGPMPLGHPRLIARRAVLTAPLYHAPSPARTARRRRRPSPLRPAPPTARAAC